MSNLTKEEIDDISFAIAQKRQEDDRDPAEVIEQDYKGDTDAYLRAMAEWHSIPIGAERALQRIIFILSDLSSISISQPVVRAVTRQLDQNDISKLISRLEQQATQAQEKKQTELCAKINQVIAFLKQ